MQACHVSCLVGTISPMALIFECSFCKGLRSFLRKHLEHPPPPPHNVRTHMHTHYPGVSWKVKKYPKKWSKKNTFARHIQNWSNICYQKWSVSWHGIRFGYTMPRIHLQEASFLKARPLPQSGDRLVAMAISDLHSLDTSRTLQVMPPNSRQFLPPPSNTHLLFS